MYVVTSKETANDVKRYTSTRYILPFIFLFPPQNRAKVLEIQLHENCTNSLVIDYCFFLFKFKVFRFKSKTLEVGS